MPAFLNWLLRLLPTNPICMRLVQGGSRRLRHMYMRSGYLAIMIVVLLFVLLTSIRGTVTLRDLASSGAQMFELVSYLQVGLICLITPVFMAGAIAQEANPKTWDILLTTPLNNLQVVLGNLFGRLFFVIALLFSSLPLFAVTQFFGGVPSESIFASYAIAGTSSLLVAAIAITLSVTRTAGKRAVFIFYITVVMYLFVTGGIDIYLRGLPGNAVAAGSNATYTTIMTPLNPFLALKVLLQSNQYVPHEFTGQAVGWLKTVWLARPISAFCWLCVWISLILVAFSTLRLRVIGASVGKVPWYRRLFRLGAKDATERPARSVGNNPVAWREATARSKTLGAVLGRWGFVAAGVLLALVLITLFHTGAIPTPNDLRLAVGVVVAAEIAIITLAALNMSATSVSREREDGSLDIILTTPIQPGPYIAGKLRGLVTYLVPMMLVPVVTVIMLAVYVLGGGFGHKSKALVQNVNVSGSSQTLDLPMFLPEGALALPLTLLPFVAFCVMIGLNQSIKSKGTIGSVITSVGIVFAVAGVVSVCGMAAGSGMGVVGAVLAAFSPLNLVLSLVFPEDYISSALSGGRGDLSVARAGLVIGAAIAAAVYSAVVYGMHTNMKRTFMMTVRRLAGTG